MQSVEPVQSHRPDLTLSFCCVTVTEHRMVAVLVCELPAYHESPQSEADLLSC